MPQNKTVPKGVITDWRPEESTFWEQTGKSIARKNLWISIPCLTLGFCVWMLFSIVAVYLNRVGFNFSTNQLFLLTAIPSISGALFRIPYSFVIPIFGGRRWTAFSTIILIAPCIWLGFAIQNPQTPYIIFIIIALLCGLGGANFASSMANISFFFPKAKQGSALGLNGGLGNMGVSVIQLVASLIIFIPLWSGQQSITITEGSLWLQNAALIWVPFLIIFAIMAFFGMNDLLSSKASFKEQSVVLKDKHMWLLSLLYLATFGSFIGFSAAFAMLAKTQFPEVNILMFAFSGPLVGAIGRPLGGMISDKFGGIRATFINYLLMILFVIILFTTLPGEAAGSGSFIGFYLCFLCLFFTAGFGSGSTFQMISIIFRQITLNKLTAAGMKNEPAQRRAATETAAALGFISAIGAIGGYFIPQVFSLSLSHMGSVSSAFYIFLVFYIFCALVTKFVYGRK
ncbi:NarK family nitrate/nitrite MFS transporter [Utexia brackfieldae]|uniref:NarK family nitrate/nitrite MFS transporter n=1 Tax=Utexia brackfieldae TaxID=3074108 RepID=UPI00370CFE36